jgi:S1-C subfamily serine protease
MKRLLFVPLIFCLLAMSVPVSQAGTDDTYVVVATTDDQGFLGVYLEELTSKTAKKKGYEGKEGVLITGIVDDSPAEKAGLEKGDIVMEAGGRSIDDSDEFEEVIESTGAGNELEVKVFRDGDVRTFTAVLVEEPEADIQIWSGGKKFGPHQFWTFGKDFYPFFHPLHRGRLGVQTQDLNPQLAKYFQVDEGVLITEIQEDSPAEKAGLEAGDVIVRIGDDDIEDTEDLQDELSDYEGGDKVQVGYVREGKEASVEVEIEDPSERFYSYRGYLGVYLQDLNDQLMEYFNVEKGVLVKEVVEDSPAEKAGIKAGDVIIRFDGEEVEDSEGLTEEVRDHDPEDEVEVVVVRDKKQKTIKVTLGKTKEKQLLRSLYGGFVEPEPFGKHIDLKEIMGDVKDAVKKSIRIKVKPDINIEDLEIDLDELNEEIKLQTDQIQKQVARLQDMEIQRHLQDNARDLRDKMRAIELPIEQLEQQIECLEKELKRLEAERLRREML